MAQEKEYKSKINLKLWKKFLTFVYPYRYHMLGLIIVMLIVGAIDATFPYLTKYAIDNYVVPKSMEGFYKFIIIFSIVILIQTLNVFLLIFFAGKIETFVAHDIRKAGFEKLQELSLSFFDSTQTGFLMARLMSDVRKITNVLAWGLTDLIWGFSSMLFIFAYLIILNWKLGLIIICAIPFLLLISLYFQNKILRQYRKVRKLNSEITGTFNEGIMGAKTTKILSVEDQHINDFKVQSDEMKRASVKAAILSSIYTPIVMSIGSITTASIIYFGGNWVYTGIITFGTLVAFINYSIQFFEPVREIARIIADLVSAQAAAERVLDLLDTEPEINEEANNIMDINIQGEIEFKHVWFKYKTGDYVLKNFNLNVKKGEVIALVGETGSGKSTIVNLVGRFYEPTKGVIYIDGVDYRKIPLQKLHSSLGYVLQTPHLFSGSVAENIRYGKLDASMDEIINAAKLVNAHEFIINLENGYDTDVGEGGSKLSTGQRQLISLARAVIADPKIFILDEATSSVDAYTEHLIQDAIMKVLYGRTSFVIAHRLSTIRNANRILVIKNGKIIEEGNHKDLMKKRSYYYNLYIKQFVEEKGKELLGEYET
ncbi:ABC transporter ATP-binding protein [Thermosipho sp. (in: thermotogales)]|jgi:ATP-binding cassette subfamily B protein|uniref:ABC transporter ATP-binding protein n=1 Tax=Thermosipho sp. (in: thermotogales) TaxID=1968895 RepID=UPI00257D65A0|nr:ABC transporter ATP-binding protein [Thermosipho sp. (in: thermotogales)]MBZ4650896.1 transporter related [Thermosipho sp. (in: thermotogales)]MDK2906250.1 ATP-binding cassette, subfamily bacterial [Petrotoga sp.]